MFDSARQPEVFSLLSLRLVHNLMTAYVFGMSA